ncbi:hypothetical protein R3P38DRAFT_2827261 [Favolaschia claudopus]|uniref:Uncharacterized protein n=1 Tax=Favolaschia claudopus TaxID=2862362 RepID=A0AAW0EI93_9AGAR
MSTIPNPTHGSSQNGLRGHRGGRSQHRTSRGTAPFQGPVDLTNALDNPRGGFPAHSRSGGQGSRGRGRGRARGSGVQYHPRGTAPFQNHPESNSHNDFDGPTWTRGRPRGRGIQYHARGSATFRSLIQSDWVDISDTPGGGGDQATGIRGRARGRGGGGGHGIVHLGRGAAPFQGSVDAEAIVNIPRGTGRGHTSAGGRRGRGNGRGRGRGMNRGTTVTAVLPEAADGQVAAPTVNGRGRGTQGRRPRGGGMRGGRGARGRPSDNYMAAPTTTAQVLPQAEDSPTHGGSGGAPAPEVDDDDHATSTPRPFTPPPPPEWNMNLLPMTEQTAILDQWLKDLESKLETQSDIPRDQWVDIAIDLLGSDEALRATEFEFDLERRGDERWDSFVQKLLRIYSGVGRDPASGAGKRTKGKGRARGEGRHTDGGGHEGGGGVAAAQTASEPVLGSFAGASSQTPHQRNRTYEE